MNSTANAAFIPSHVAFSKIAKAAVVRCPKMVSIVFTEQEMDDFIDLEKATHIKKPEKAKLTAGDDRPQIHRADESISKNVKRQQHIPSTQLERCPPPQVSHGRTSTAFKENKVRNRSTEPNQQNGMQTSISLDTSSLFGYILPLQHSLKQSDWIPNFLKPGRSTAKHSMPEGLQLRRSIEQPEMHLPTPTPTPKHVEVSHENGKPTTEDFRDKFYEDEFDFQDPWEVDISDADLQ